MARFRGTRSVSQRHHPLLGAGCHNVGVAAEADWTGDTTTTQASAEGKLDRWFYCPALRKQRNRALFSVNDGRGILCSEPPGRERLAVEGPRRGVVVAVVFGRWDPGEVKKTNRRKEGGEREGKGSCKERDPAPRLTWLRSRLVSSSPALSSCRSERHPTGFASWAFSSPNQQFSLLTHHRSAEMPL